MAEEEPEEGSEPEDEPGEEPEEEVEEEEVETTTWWEDFRDYYLAFDRRTLGIARIFLGIFLIFDLWRRSADWFDMFANDGVLPSHFALWRPQSSGYTGFTAFSSHGELIALWLFGMAVYLCILVGYKTKVAQVIAAVYVASMNGRVLLIENGGYVVHNLLMLWTAFLPLGDRFSLDALLASMRRQKERNAKELNDRTTDVAAWRTQPFVSLVGIVILLQLAAIYGFNVVHKTGRAWHDGTAVHYVLYVDRMVNPLIGLLREHTPQFILIILTKAVMGMEAGLPVALLSPLARVWAKRIAIVFVNLLHIGFGSTFVLGPFAWALCCFSVLLLSREDWELAVSTMRREHRRRVVRYDPASPVAFFWCRLIKRLDRFELLSFEADGKAQGIEVTTPGGARIAGAAAKVHIVSAFPAGPLIAWSMYLLSPLAAWIAPLFFAAKRQSFEKKKKRGYQPELRDDAGGPTVDVYYFRDWLEETYGGTRRWFVWLGAWFFAGFVTIYGAPMLRKLEEPLDFKMTDAVVGSFTRENVVFWLGFTLLVITSLGVFVPLWRMNWQAPSSALRKWFRVRSVVRELIVFAFFCGAINQALVELWVARPLQAPQPTVTRLLAHKMRYLQGWFMFSPNPVMDDGTIVVDAITVDNRRVDPFTIEFPDYTLRPPLYDLTNTKSYRYNQIWSDYFNRMHMPANTAFRKPMQEYMLRLPERTGNPNDAIVKGTVYWVNDVNPRFGKTQATGYNRKELFKFTNPDNAVHERWRALTGGEDPPEIPLPPGS